MSDLTLNKPIYNKSAPCIAKIKEKILLNSSDSNKKTYHISLNIEGTGLHFHPGDSIGILPQNDPGRIQALLSCIKESPEEEILHPASQKTMTLSSYLTTKVNLSRINTSLLRSLFEKDINHPLAHLIEPENKADLSLFLAGKDLADVLEEINITPSIQDLLEHVSPLLPRFYSIASSLKAHANEVHLLVALSSHSYKNETRYGVASHFLCHLADDVTEIPLYVQPSMHFKIPEDTQKDMIMIGPGTGVAPYRAFLQERLHQEAEGKHWLFFGGRNQSTDFFYEEFWSSLQKENKLKLSTAFSRDQEHKIYVQHRLLEESKEVWKWLEQGALFYICGDASQMAKDVEKALLKIIEIEGGFSELDAKSYFKSLKTSKRYLPDVY